jgi:hypothetical protein
MTYRAICRGLLLAVLAATIGYGVTQATAQELQKAIPPLSLPQAERLAKDPQAAAELMARLPTVPAARLEPTEPPSSPWQHTAIPFPGTNGSAGNPLLLTDGTVLVHDDCGADWWKLTPDIHGNYANGSWKQGASLPAGYAPIFFGSAVLPDGRVLIEGGEYNSVSGNFRDCNAVWTPLGAIYDPTTNRWTSVTRPAGWSTIGDAQNTVLANLTDMQADCCHIYFQGGAPAAALFNAATRTWKATGAGKFDDYDEEGWTLLPDKQLLTVDSYVFTGTCGQNSELYNPVTGKWSSAGNVGVVLSDCASPGGKSSFELGPQVLRPDGTVVAFAGTTCNFSSNKSCSNGTLKVVSPTAIYNSTTGTWKVGPNLPTVGGRNYTLADAPAALEPNGKVLFAASPNYITLAMPTHFFEFSSTNTIAQVADNADAGATGSFEWSFLVLPTGQILATHQLSADIWIYTPSGSPQPSWVPTISTFPNPVVRGTKYSLTGRQFNGLSQGAAYGDDVQANTNYPIVRVVNRTTGHVFYARTTNPNTMSVAPNTVSSVSFVLPTTVKETGTSSLYVVTNGIPSAAKTVIVK